MDKSKQFENWWFIILLLKLIKKFKSQTSIHIESEEEWKFLLYKRNDSYQGKEKVTKP